MGPVNYVDGEMAAQSRCLDIRQRIGSIIQCHQGQCCCSIYYWYNRPSVHGRVRDGVGSPNIQIFVIRTPKLNKYCRQCFLFVCLLCGYWITFIISVHRHSSHPYDRSCYPTFYSPTPLHIHAFHYLSLQVIFSLQSLIYHLAQLLSFIRFTPTRHMEYAFTKSLTHTHMHTHTHACAHIRTGNINTTCTVLQLRKSYVLSQNTDALCTLSTQLQI